MRGWIMCTSTHPTCTTGMNTEDRGARLAAQLHSCPRATHSPSIACYQLAQMGRGAVEKGHVVEGVPHDGLCDSARRGAAISDDEDARVVVGHRQAAVVFGLRGFAQRDPVRAP